MAVKMRFLALVALCSASVLAGCGVSDDWYGSDRSAGVEVTPKGSGGYGGRTPSPAPEKEAATPAPSRASAPAAMPNSSGVMYYPTGDRATSAIMLERFAPAEVVAGQEFDYSYKVTNLTSMELRDVMLKDSISQGATIARSDPQFMGSAPDLSWALGSLSAGQSKTVRLTAKSSGASGSLTNCASVSYNSLLCVTTQVVQPALKVTISKPDVRMICDEICARIVVENSGTGVARNTRVTYNLPEGWAMADGRTSQTFDAGDLTPGQKKEATVCAKAKRTGNFSSSAGAVADGGLTATSNNASTMVRQPVLTITAQCPPATLIGRQMTFAFIVKNTGDAVSTNTTMSSALPTGTTFVSADNGGTATAGGSSWNLGDIAPGASKTVSYVVRNTGAGSLSASASVRGDCATEVSANCTVAVTGTADIGTLVTDDDGVVIVGANHTYRVEVKNQGQINLTNVKMIVTLPADMVFVSSADGRVMGNKVEFSFGTMAPGAINASSFIVKSTKAGEKLVVGETTCNELKTPIRNDELTNFID